MTDRIYYSSAPAMQYASSVCLITPPDKSCSVNSSVDGKPAAADESAPSKNAIFIWSFSYPNLFATLRAQPGIESDGILPFPEALLEGCMIPTWRPSPKTSSR